MANSKYETTQDVIDKLQSVKGKKLKVFQNINIYFDEMTCRIQSGTFQFEEYPFADKAEGISEIFPELLFLLEFLQTKPQVRSMFIKSYEFYYTVFENRNEKLIANDELFEKNKCDNNNYDNSVKPKYDIGFTHRETRLRWRKLRSQINLFELFMLYK